MQSEMDTSAGEIIYVGVLMGCGCHPAPFQAGKLLYCQESCCGEGFARFSGQL